MKTLIAATTSADFTTIKLSAGNAELNPGVPVTIWAGPTIGAGEEVTLEVPTENGWMPLVTNGNEAKIDQNTNNQSLFAPLEIRISKSATASPVGVYMSDV